MEFKYIVEIREFFRDENSQKKVIIFTVVPNPLMKGLDEKAIKKLNIEIEKYKNKGTPLVELQDVSNPYYKVIIEGFNQ